MRTYYGRQLIVGLELEIQGDSFSMEDRKVNIFLGRGEEARELKRSVEEIQKDLKLDIREYDRYECEWSLYLISS